MAKHNKKRTGEIIYCNSCRKYKSKQDFGLTGKYLRYECKVCHAAYQRIYNKKYAKLISEKLKNRRLQLPEVFKKRHKVYKYKLRKSIIDHYGAKCACCGETTFEFLSIDHINGSGRGHRKIINRKGYKCGTQLYSWLKNNNFPEGFQILCYNCNCAKGFCGRCPHEKKI